MRFSLSCLFLPFLCSHAYSQTVEGKLPFIVNGETFETYYKIVGPLSSGIPLVALHGGPGNTHNYLLSLSDLVSSNRAVVFYDQLGNGNSTHLRDMPASFWTPDLFMKELANLLKGLGIAKKYDLLGQSWGGMLGSQFASTYTGKEVKGLRRLVLSSSPASMDLFVQSTHELVEQLPEPARTTLLQGIACGNVGSAEYQDALYNVYYRTHLCRLDPIPQNLLDSLAWMERDPTVYNTMNGPDELNVNGTLNKWTIISHISKITVPTLLLSGKYDEVQPLAMQPFFDRIPHVDSWTVMDNSSHTGFVEERERYMQVVRTFLDKAI